MWHVNAGWSLGRSILVTILALLVLCQGPPPAWAWGRLGHRVTSRFAEKNLSPNAKAASGIKGHK